MFVEYLLFARHSAYCWGHLGDQERHGFCSHGNYGPEGMAVHSGYANQWIMVSENRMKGVPGIRRRNVRDLRHLLSIFPSF